MKFSEQIKKNAEENVSSTILFFQPWKWSRENRREVFKLCLLVYATCWVAISLFCISHDSHLMLTKEDYNVLDFFNPFCQECVSNEVLNNQSNNNIIFNQTETEVIEWDKMN